MVCEGINYCETGISKKDNCYYKFEYVKKEDMPDNFKKISECKAYKSTC